MENAAIVTTNAPHIAATTKGGAPKPGRKNKRQWRKNIDLGTVEQGLEKVREEERIVGKPLAEHTAEDIFTVDTGGDEKIAKRIPKKLKTDMILDARSKVPALKKIKGQDEIAAEKKKKKAERLLQEKLKKIAGRERDSAASEVFAKPERVYDMWDQPAEPIVVERKGKFAKPKIKMPHTLTKRQRVDLPSVEVAHPGASYFPEKSQHSELLNRAAEKELKVIQENERVEQALKAYELVDHEVIRKEEAEADKLIVERLEKIGNISGNNIDSKEFSMTSEELNAVIEKIANQDYSDNEDTANEDSDSDSSGIVEGSGSDSGTEGLQLSAKEPTKRKTKAQRNRQKRLKQKHQEDMRLKRENALRHQLQMAKSINMTVEEKTRLREEELARRQKQREEDEHKPRTRYGFIKIKEEVLQVKPSDEITGSLRTLRPEGNLFEDNFINKQKRSLIEPRVPTTQKRKTKLKFTEKWSFKDFT